MNQKLARQQHVMGKRVEGWNQHYPVGTPVRFWTGCKEGEGRVSRTRSEAFLLGGHTACVMVEGHSSGVALTHVEPLEDQAAA
jgi:hypothetical protein